MVEAPITGMKPVAVTDQANTNEIPISSTIDKLKTSLEKIPERLKNH